MIQKHYEILGVSRTADLEALKQAAKDKAAELKRAYAVLTDADARRKYDQVLDEEFAREASLVTRRPIARSSPEPHGGQLIKAGSREPLMAADPPVMRPRKAVLIAVPLLCVALGFFMGREHLKYELRTSIAQGLEEVGREWQRSMENLGRTLAGETEQPTGRVATAPRSRPVSAPEPRPAPAPAPPREAPDFRVELLTKGFLPRDFPSRPDSIITFKLRFQNPFDRAVRAFNGTVVFRDILGEDIHRVRLTEDSPVQPRERWEWEGGIDYNQFIDAHQKLVNTNSANMQVEFLLQKVLFADGSTEEF